MKKEYNLPKTKRSNLTDMKGVEVKSGDRIEIVYFIPELGLEERLNGVVKVGESGNYYITSKEMGFDIDITPFDEFRII